MNSVWFRVIQSRVKNLEVQYFWQGESTLIISQIEKTNQIIAIFSSCKELQIFWHVIE